MTAFYYSFRSLLATLLLGATLCAFRPSLPAGPREVRELPAFTDVALGTSVTVMVRQGSPQRVEVEGLPEDLPKIQTEVAGQLLYIRKVRPADQPAPNQPRNQEVPLSGPVVVYVTMPVVQKLSVSSSGRLQADTLRGRDLQLTVSGSGRRQAAQVQAGRVRAALSSSGSLTLGLVRADSLRAAVSGSGTLAAAGACTYTELALSSSGSFNAEQLAAQDCWARLSGSGSARVQVARTLDACLSSSGNLLVAGTPQLTSHVSGSGRVRTRTR